MEDQFTAILIGAPRLDGLARPENPHKFFLSPPRLAGRNIYRTDKV
jgi:hypothetical protein